MKIADTTTFCLGKNNCFLPKAWVQPTVDNRYCFNLKLSNIFRAEIQHLRNPLALNKDDSERTDLNPRAPRLILQHETRSGKE